MEKETLLKLWLRRKTDADFRKKVDEIKKAEKEGQEWQH